MNRAARFRGVVVAALTILFFVVIGVAAFARTGGTSAGERQIGSCTVRTAPEPGAVTTCPEQDLAGVRFATVDLRLADLHGADLRGSDLRDSVLYGADLQGANLRGADLRGVDLYSADLRGADLRDADLGSADLTVADISGAQIDGIDLSKAKLAGLTVTGTPLELADRTLQSPDGNPVTVPIRLDLPRGVSSTSCVRQDVQAPVGTTQVRCRMSTDADRGGRLDQRATITVTGPTP
ncbi:pentapeptide repeat-containing protein [Curtobacterium flaccumfaciens pv. flaccumfaciens]|uniref:pentapeptide repeat-containing protein n=1 Tax=Curtobacterium TaxID=2034 RepID=UPI00217DD660|nr:MULTISPECIES: pentapeptide repeat-containing protein [Curtobacterium]MCS6565127.1 pentapeptide repeat-containing protein [Curtobacterium flaccumfaciens pv. flaccumfaciens]